MNRPAFPSAGHPHPMLPDFIIIGAMKAGTTSLYHYLASHPEVVASDEKETDFFRSKKRATGGADAYGRLFNGSGAHAFEASPNYTKRHRFRGVPQRMHAVVPDARLIYLLRDPVERAISHYRHSVRKGRETRPFAEAIRERDNPYVQTSRYHYQLRAFLKYYGENRILLVESEKLRDDTRSTLDAVSAFLGLDPSYDPRTLKTKFHQSGRPNGLLGSIRAHRRPEASPEPSPADRGVLKDRLMEDVERLRRYAGLGFENWSL